MAYTSFAESRPNVLATLHWNSRYVGLPDHALGNLPIRSSQGTISMAPFPLPGSIGHRNRSTVLCPDRAPCLPFVSKARFEDSLARGRWLTPDPGGVKVVNMDTPQTWNMYAYVADNPTTDTDRPAGCDRSLEWWWSGVTGRRSRNERPRRDDSGCHRWRGRYAAFR